MFIITKKLQLSGIHKIIYCTVKMRQAKLRYVTLHIKFIGTNYTKLLVFGQRSYIYSTYSDNSNALITQCTSNRIFNSAVMF
jgi:hypothetical protein